MKEILFFVFASLVIASCTEQNSSENPVVSADSILASGQMPDVVKDKSNTLHVVYGTGDSIMYTHSTNQGKIFSVPVLISVLPGLAASHTRGPQVAVTSKGLVLTACTNSGDIFSYVKDVSGKWKQTARVNDIDTVAKENLMALSADGQNAFAVWLDLRDKHNKIYGAKSTDGGNTWIKNTMIYTSPDTTVCECCKPSVVMKGNNVYVMFRNWLNGNRDLHFIQSSDGGLTFGQAQKLGIGSWALNGCPMDGGGLTLNNNEEPQTVWNRKGKIYACEPGKEEVELGQGRSCTMESVNGKNVYAWVEKGDVVVLKPQGIKINLGKGQLPVIKAVDNNHILCVWEVEKKIHKAVLEI